MIEKRTILIQTEITEGRTIIAHFAQIVYDDGQEIARSKPHTATFRPDSDPPQMLTEINADITVREGMKWNPIESDEWARAVAHCEIEYTPAVKAAYEAFKLSQMRPKADETSSKTAA